MHRLRRLFEFNVVVGLTVFWAAYSWSTVVDPDVFWHIKNGELIRHAGALFYTDPFSHTAHGAPLTVHGWLFDLCIEYIWRSHGEQGVKLLIAIFALLTWLFMYKACRLYLFRLETAALVSLLGFFFVSSTLGPRPNLFTHLAFAIVLFQLLWFRLTGDSKSLWSLPLLFVIWPNIHYGFASGQMLIGLFLASEALDRFFPFKQTPQSYRLTSPTPLVIFSLCALAPIANPVGINIYPEVLFMTARGAASFVTEWYSPDFKTGFGRMLLASFSILGISQLRSDRTDSWIRVIVPIVLASGALSGIRNVTFWGIAFSPFLAINLQRIFYASDVRPVRRESSLVDCAKNSVAAILMIVGTTISAGKIVDSQRASASQFLPLAATDYLKANLPDGRLFNLYGSGGYLLYATYPKFPVFIDGRYAPYSDKILADYQLIMSSQPNATELLLRYGVEIVLIPVDAPLVSVLVTSTLFRQIYSDSQFTLWVRRSAKFDGISPGRIE